MVQVIDNTDVTTINEDCVEDDKGAVIPGLNTIC